MSLARYLSKLAAFLGSDGKVPPAGLSTGAPTWDANSRLTVPGLIGGGTKDSTAPGIYFDKQTSSSESYIPFARAEGDSTTTHLAIGASSTSGEARVYAGGGQRIVAKPNGQVSLPMGQLAFPATQNPSSDANTLDDYEEGTYTPSDFSGALLSLTNNGSYYTKIGRLVSFSLDVTYPATTNGSGLVISLPFSPLTDSAAAIGYTTYSPANFTCAQISNGAAGVRLQSSGGVGISNATLSGKRIQLAGCYYI